MDQEQKKAKKTKLLDKFVVANHPYFARNGDKTINIPINSMDCIRIFELKGGLKKDQSLDPVLWCPLHMITINAKENTVFMDNDPSTELKLVRNETYERPRGESSLRADASNCNLKGK